MEEGDDDDDDGCAFFRTIFKLEEEVNNEVEVTLLEEDFAKALKQQILL